MAYDYTPFPFAVPQGLSEREDQHPVLIVGAGPIGLALALELARLSVRSVVLDDNNVVAMGSRAICWSRHSLKFFDRIGLGKAILDKGEPWSTVRYHHGDREIFEDDLGDDGEAVPAYLNLQQYHLETFLVEAAQASDLIDLRFQNRVTMVEQDDSAVHVSITTPQGDYRLQGDFLVACDGMNSSIRRMMGLRMSGTRSEDRFVIADVEMMSDEPAERRFWFSPGFHTGRSALMYKQPDHLWRIELQLNPDDDPQAEQNQERVAARIALLLGHDDFRLDWVSVHSFQCSKLEKYVSGAVIFAGDSAHVLAPFGARGANSGIADVENLGWKLAAVLRGQADAPLLDGYSRERAAAAEEHILSTLRSTRFISPSGPAEEMFREQILRLAASTGFARPIVNAGRMVGIPRYDSAGPDDDRLPEASSPGRHAPDPDGHLFDNMPEGPALLTIGTTAPDIGLQVLDAPENPAIFAAYRGSADQAIYLLRPDRVVAGRWVAPGEDDIGTALEQIWEGRI